MRFAAFDHNDATNGRLVLGVGRGVSPVEEPGSPERPAGGRNRGGGCGVSKACVCG